MERGGKICPALGVDKVYPLARVLQFHRPCRLRTGADGDAVHVVAQRKRADADMAEVHVAVKDDVERVGCGAACGKVDGMPGACAFKRFAIGIGECGLEAERCGTVGVDSGLDIRGGRTRGVIVVVLPPAATHPGA